MRIESPAPSTQASPLNMIIKWLVRLKVILTDVSGMSTNDVDDVDSSVVLKVDA